LSAVVDNSSILRVKPNSFQEGTRSIAMMIFFISMGMFFATLLLGYMLFRFTSPSWPPLGVQEVSLFYPILSSILIVLSSASLMLFKLDEDGENWVHKRNGLLISVLLGLGFLFSQWQLWTHLNEIGLFVSSGVFASILHAFTWIHAAHMVIGLLGLLGLTLLIQQKKNRSLLYQYSWIKGLEQFWHFLGIIWFVLFLALFIL
jgi:cytochrome c oxidase subunit III